jgi:hypothetical protein
MVETKDESQKTEVILTKESFNRRGDYEHREKLIPVPELNHLMKLEGKQTAHVKIRQLTLSEFLAGRIDISNQMKNLVEGVLSASVKKELVADEVLASWDKMGPEERYRIAVVEAGLIEPKLNRSDIVFISKMFPMVLIRIADAILDLTNKGGDVKKNSKK